jgi:hypothetical protein
MNLFKKIVIGFVFYTFPLAIVDYLIIGLYENSIIPHTGALELWTLIPAAFWTLITFFLTIAMFFSKRLRNDVLEKLSGMKERDEREVQIVGKALKSTYLSTMTILLFLLIISLFDIRVEKKSVDSVEPGQLRNSASIHAGFEILDKNAIITEKEGYDEYFEINDLPISSSTLIILLILWQIFSYRRVTRRAFKTVDSRNTD